MVKYRRIYIGSAAVGVTLISFFIFMISLGANIVSDGDQICFGTPADPCISFINITVPVTFYIYNHENIALNFSPGIKDYDLYLRDRRYTKTCIKDICGWKIFNLTEKKEGYEYVYKFYPDKVYEFALLGYKNHPREVIKWEITAANGELDPVWNGYNQSVELLNQTITKMSLAEFEEFQKLT